MAMPQILMGGASVMEFLQGLQEQHMSELAFLLAQRQRQLHDARVEWPDVELLEVRVLRHAEAMCVGGDVALACAREALASDAFDELAAGSYVRVLLGPGEEGIEEVLARIASLDVALLSHCAQPLMLAPHPRMSSRLEDLLPSSGPSLRAFAARVMGLRRDGDAESLLPLLDDNEPDVRASAALAVSKLGYRPALPVFERKLAQAPAGEMHVWALAALRVGSSRALQVCRQACRALGTPPPRLTWLLGLAGDAQDFGVVRTLCGRAETLVEGLDALGLLGVPEAVPLLLEHVGHGAPEVKSAAAAALVLMTGAELTETVELPTEGAGEGGEVESALRVRTCTDSSAWRVWWEAHRPRLDGLSRMRLGQPFHLSVCLQELAHPRTSLAGRERAGQELSIRSGQTVGFHPEWPVRYQRQAIEQWRQVRAVHARR
ncbi:HEAT repeat domain-containing protein [Myxococcus hansupus]|uniref:HEAT repeat domain-containing protein n=1 Tax=Pseudomyxococcus hansupus TaxID=1297742 RepID=UPI00030B1EB1|nr:HEAT repeat domain-containing protein [Myxococcus hansupus]